MKDITKENIIKNEEFGGERPLYNISNVLLDNITIGDGESAIKHGNSVFILKSNFYGKYVLWHNNDLTIDETKFFDSSRSSIWYSSNITVNACDIYSPKMFRECNKIYIELTRFNNADEIFWYCDDIHLSTIYMNDGTYPFLNSQNIYVTSLTSNSKYIFQKCKNIVIYNSNIISKDAFWESENVTVYNSIISSEYLGWHSKNLRLVNCKLSGEQILCYADNLMIENCEFDPNCDRMFEYSTGKINTNIDRNKIQNPTYIEF